MRVFVLAITLSLAACTDEAPSEVQSEGAEATDAVATLPDTVKQEDKMAEVQTYTGTIVFKSMEGGFYAFEGNDGARFTLMGMDPSHNKHGLIVEISGMPAHDIMTTSMYGTPFKLDTIKIIDDSQVDESIGAKPTY